MAAGNGWPNEQLLLAAVLVALLVLAMPRMLPVIRRWTERVLKRPLPLPVPQRGPFALYVVRVALGWVGYGLAFWMLTHALLGDAAPSAWVAVTSYVASYMVGLLAVLAPGGLVVRLRVRSWYCSRHRSGRSRRCSWRWPHGSGKSCSR